ncbi:3-oxoacyl-[acyl-carrier protein] reductase [Minicystis rosea]|nr:3-oxoacyl-[acyl-carrier protein] reductase [Minicystis rosea]
MIRTLGAAAAGLSLLAIARLARRRMRRLDLSGRVAIVTGGSRGLGLLIAEELGRRGARVAICGRDQSALDEAEKRLREQGIDVLARRADLGDRGQAEVFVERAALEWERVDILVNVAGVIHVEPAATTTLESVDEAMRSNFWSAAHATFAALPHLRAQGRNARVVNVVSIGGRVAVPHLLGYSASKFALAGFSEGLAAELLREGIRVTTVFPWLMRTGSFYNAEFGGDQKRELAWFRAGASLPLLTVGARRAARRIVRAARDGETIVHLGAPSAILARVHGLAPALAVRALSLVNRFLPSADGATESARRGREIEGAGRIGRIFGFGERAARANNEQPPQASRT